MDGQILEHIERNNAERELLDLEISNQRTKRLRSTLATRKMPTRKPKVTTDDKITIPGMSGTLGARILTVSNDIVMNCWNSKYIGYISRNVVIDFNNKAQLKMIGVKLVQLKKYSVDINITSRSIKTFEDILKKARNHNESASCLIRIENYKYQYNERAIKMIYMHILDQIVNKPILFTTTTQKKLSEMSFIVKFWGPVMEQYFDPNVYFVQWGDTKSPYLMHSNIGFKLDLRIVITDINDKEVDVFTGEFASYTATIASKMNRDLLKSVLATKGHLNAILEKMPYIPANKIDKVVLPLIQIMGLSCIVYTMNIIDKKLYTVQKVASFNYPSTLRELKAGSIKKVLDGFALIDATITNVNEMIAEFSRTPTNTLSDLLNGKRKNAGVDPIKIEDYISKIIPCNELEDDSNSNGESDDNDNDDDDDSDDNNDEE
ncbi:hypothetical protein MFLAVUS_010734 [Mucor flavus]|uniref:Uncharacterized protein n=1 Tax=Mucor flavus TaxID=439312 RepID=A0ABP9ZDM6_9FUNG